MEKFIPYIGLPYGNNGRENGIVDCWGLVVTIYSDLYGVELPRYKECNFVKEGRKGTSSFITGTGLYKECQKLSIEEQPQEGDLILIDNAGQPTHIGMVVDKDHMIHAFDKGGSVIESFRSNKWKAKIRAFYRHPYFLS